MFRSSWIEINLDALRHNLQVVKKRTDKEIICVIKANGYGSGDYPIIKTALQEGIKTFAVSSLDEAIVLRNEGIEQNILILGYVHPKHISLCAQYKLIATIVSLDWLEKVIKQNPIGLDVHLKIDTGMNRIGVKSIEEAKSALDLCLENNIHLEGIYTHFACSDIEDQKMTKKQFTQFKSIVENLNYSFKYIHTSNSDAIFSFEDNLSNAVRLGVSMFGISTYSTELKPVFSLYSSLSCIKIVPKGESVSYGASYTTLKDEIIGTLPIGYADGWWRKNQGRHVWIDGELVPLVGRICMDQCMIQLSSKKPIDTPVELFGNHIPIEQVAKELDTIPYEILTSLSERLTRIYIRNCHPVAEFNARLFRSSQNK